MQPRWKTSGLHVALAVLLAALLCVFTSQQNTANASVFNTPFVLHCTQITGTKAHLNVMSGQLTFQSATLQDVTISRNLPGGHHQLVISTNADVQSTNVIIQTSLFADPQNFESALGMFLQQPEDMAKLLVGATVDSLTLKNVTLNIDGYLKADSMTMPNMQVQLQ